jgi:hypothetical protein
VFFVFFLGIGAFFLAFFLRFLFVLAAAARAVADDIKNGRAAESVGDGGAGGLYLEGFGSLLAELEVFLCFLCFFLGIGAFFFAFFLRFLFVLAAAARAVADDIKNGRAAESVGEGGAGGLYLEGIGSLLAELEMFWCFLCFFYALEHFF